MIKIHNNGQCHSHMNAISQHGLLPNCGDINNIGLRCLVPKFPWFNWIHLILFRNNILVLTHIYQTTTKYGVCVCVYIYIYIYIYMGNLVRLCM
ncbi:hypothetical protein LSH36_32g13024 [Paralvinella palmiformis]|uniref:Uncharacterized protein n=1 Tax=Paralvinella palmiformis TaxID=53620 RepID=A0AAD9KAV1_9ANNE|nr:hypothetical protein LSH36_32g13024 [Paralvinella palmiformis]